MADSVRDEGYSLWLIPPESSSLFEALQELIEFAIPSIYPGTLTPSFTPHVTLTAGMIDPELVGQDPQAWLDNLALPRSTSNLKVTISELHIGSIFFQKLIMLCEKSSELCDLAMFCRALGTMEEESANDWVQENSRPHCSLMYTDLPEDEVRCKLDVISSKITETRCNHPDAVSAKGAQIWLVPTFRPVKEWKPVAVRQLPGVQWRWET